MATQNATITIGATNPTSLDFEVNVRTITGRPTRRHVTLDATQAQTLVNAWVANAPAEVPRASLTDDEKPSLFVLAYHPPESAISLYRWPARADGTWTTENFPFDLDVATAKPAKLAPLKLYNYTAHNPRISKALGDDPWHQQVAVYGMFPSKAAFIRAMLEGKVIYFAAPSTEVFDLSEGEGTWSEEVVYVNKLAQHRKGTVRLDSLPMD